jgi:hypothetical protein
MQHVRQLERILEQQLAQRSIARAPGPMAFVHQGNVVRVTVNESLYRGLFVTVHDKPYGSRQFRACAGTYDWDAIAEAIVEIVERHRQSQAPRHSRVDERVANAPLSIRPSTASPGHVRVKLSEMELDAASAMQLYALIQRALPATQAHWK